MVMMVMVIAAPRLATFALAAFALAGLALATGRRISIEHVRCRASWPVFSLFMGDRGRLVVMTSPGVLAALGLGGFVALRQAATVGRRAMPGVIRVILATGGERRRNSRGGGE